MAVVCSISLLIKGKCFKACCSCSCWRMRQTIMDNNNIVSFNDTGLTVLILVVNCRPTRLYIRGIRWRYMMEKESVTSTGSLRNYQEIHEKWLNFGSPLGVKKLEVFQLQGLRPPDPLTRGSVPEPRWGSAPRPPL